MCLDGQKEMTCQGKLLEGLGCSGLKDGGLFKKVGQALAGRSVVRVQACQRFSS